MSHSIRAHRLFLSASLGVAMALLSNHIDAHEMTMAEMDVRETSPGDFAWMWSAQNDKRPMGDDLRPVWPAHCTTDQSLLHCGDRGLKGTLAVEGVGKRYSAALVKIAWLDGQSHVYTITSAQPSVQLYGSADDRRGRGEIVRAYTILGVEHILSGVDHLLFVAGLLFLVGFRRRLIGTISAFTLAHSLTLACSAFGWLTLRPAPVEAVIAMSIVLVASEGLHNRDTLARRMPALVSFLFGLVHGLGFAGALKNIGLPQSHLPLALFSFNVGVEAGQLFAVLVAYLVVVRAPMARGWFGILLGRWLTVARRPALFAIGIVASYWTWARVAAVLF